MTTVIKIKDHEEIKKHSLDETCLMTLFSKLKDHKEIKQFKLPINIPNVIPTVSYI